MNGWMDTGKKRRKEDRMEGETEGKKEELWVYFLGVVVCRNISQEKGVKGTSGCVLLLVGLSLSHNNNKP